MIQRFLAWHLKRPLLGFHPSAITRLTASFADLLLGHEELVMRVPGYEHGYIRVRTQPRDFVAKVHYWQPAAKEWREFRFAVVGRPVVGPQKVWRIPSDDQAMQGLVPKFSREEFTIVHRWISALTGYFPLKAQDSAGTWVGPPPVSGPALTEAMQ